MKSYDQLQHWLLHNPYGRYILAHERVFYHNLSPTILGNYSLQIGFTNINFLHGNKIPNHYIINHDIKATLTNLPFASNSINLIVCPHTLELCTNHSNVLAECYRILAPSGIMIVTSFNYSYYYRLFSLLNRKVPQIPYIKLSVLKQELYTLNFNIIGGKFFGYRLPYDNAKRLDNVRILDKIGDRWFPTLAQTFGLVLQKDIITTNRITCNYSVRSLAYQ